MSSLPRLLDAEISVSHDFPLRGRQLHLASRKHAGTQSGPMGNPMGSFHEASSTSQLNKARLSGLGPANRIDADLDGGLSVSDTVLPKPAWLRITRNLSPGVRSAD